MNKKTKCRKVSFQTAIISITIILIIAWICWPFIITWVDWSFPNYTKTAEHTYSDWGYLGNLFNAFNPLISILGFAAVLYSIFIQDVNNRYKVYLNMIFEFNKFHRELKLEHKAEAMIDATVRAAAAQYKKEKDQEKAMRGLLVDIIKDWEISYAQLLCIIVQIEDGSKNLGDKYDILKDYIATSFNTDDRTAFSVLALFVNCEPLQDFLKEYEFITKQDELIVHLAKSYVRNSAIDGNDTDEAKKAVSSFLNSIKTAINKK